MPPTDVGPEQNIVARLRRRCEDRLDRVATVGNRSCRFPTLTYGALFEEMELIAAGLEDLGIGPGHHVGLVAENSDLWLLTDLALMALGAVDVPRGGDAPASEVAFCLGHARCRAAVVETAAQVPKLDPIRHELQPVVVMRGEAPPGTVSFHEVRERGRERLAREPDRVRRAIERVGQDDLATIIYTSGTTGNPKGVMLTHRNLLHNIRIVPHVIALAPGDRFLSFLPSWHSFERTIDYVVVDCGVELHYGNKRTLREDFARVRPTFVVGVPRVWETFYNGLLKELARLRGPVRRLVHGMMAGSRVRCAALRKARGLDVAADGRVLRARTLERLGLELVAVALLPAHVASDLAVYRKLRRAFGGRLRAAVSGGGPLPRHVDEFLNQAGVPLRNGYGLTESSPVISVRRERPNRLGTIGPPIPETEVRVVDEEGRDLGRLRRGIIQARGPQIMQGYYRNEDASKTALPGDGWLNTGDVGMISSKGDLIITGRAKDTIVLSGGENVEPEPLEAVLMASPLIEQAVVVGHGQKTLGALLVPDAEALAAALRRNGAASLAELAGDPAAEALLRREVGRCLARERGFRPFEQVGQIRVLARPFGIDDGTLTATLKIRRAEIERRYADLIAAMFEG